MKSLKIVSCLAIYLITSIYVHAWFDPSPGYYGKIIITRANTYETYPDEAYLTSGLSTMDTNWFDNGDVDLRITETYGGNPSNTFNVEYPITFFFWFQSSYNETGYNWDQAKFQYHIGTNTELSTSWTTIYTITNFPSSFLDNQTTQFKVMTWEPPIKNTNYLVRVWGRLENGWQNGNLVATGIDKDGDGITWQDSEVLLIESSPFVKPGTRN